MNFRECSQTIELTTQVTKYIILLAAQTLHFANATKIPRGTIED